MLHKLVNKPCPKLNSAMFFRKKSLQKLLGKGKAVNGAQESTHADCCGSAAQCQGFETQLILNRKQLQNGTKITMHKGAIEGPADK